VQLGSGETLGLDEDQEQEEWEVDEDEEDEMNHPSSSALEWTVSHKVPEVNVNCSVVYNVPDSVSRHTITTTQYVSRHNNDITLTMHE